MLTTLTRWLKAPKPSATFTKPRYDRTASTASSVSTAAKPNIILVFILRLVKKPNSPAEGPTVAAEALITALFIGSGNERPCRHDARRHWRRRPVDHSAKLNGERLTSD